jgi:hypothetical protein
MNESERSNDYADGDRSMARSIAINGTRLDEVRMPLKPAGNGSISHLSYPMKEIRFGEANDGLSLVVPAYLAVELYRRGILPQDAALPAEITIDGHLIGWFTVTDVRYPDTHDNPFGQVTFTLTRFLPGADHDSMDSTSRSQTSSEGGTYVTDITHYLNETGELAPPSGPARKIASFLTLLIEAATSVPSGQEHDSRVRCRVKGCKGTIRTRLVPAEKEIGWYCPACRQNGFISNWHKTKWNQMTRGAEPG